MSEADYKNGYKAGQTGQGSPPPKSFKTDQAAKDFAAGRDAAIKEQQAKGGKK